MACDTCYQSEMFVYVVLKRTTFIKYDKYINRRRSVLPSEILLHEKKRKTLFKPSYNCINVNIAISNKQNNAPWL